MPLTEAQHKFVTRFIARVDETPTEARPGKVKTPVDLEKKLADVGRVRDATVTPVDQEETQQDRREKHLQDILLRDEDGLNAKQIVDKLAPVTKDELKLARTPKDSKNTAIHGQIDNAVAKLEKQRAMQLFVGEQLIAKRNSAMTGTVTKREATNKAIADLADSVHQNSISHHASRHGPQTTIEQHVIRIATGFAPDDPIPAYVGPLDVIPITTRGIDENGDAIDTVAVDVPKVREKGPNAAGGASRSGSGETALYMLEDALSKVHESSSYNKIDSGNRYIVDSLQRSDGAIVGEAARVENVNEGTALQPSYVAEDGTALPSPNQLTGGGKTATQKDAIIKKRAEAVMIDRKIKSSKVVIEAMPDGSFRTITAFPDARVTSDGFGKSNGPNAPETPKTLTDERAAAQLLAKTEAKAYAKKCREDADKAAKDRAVELATKKQGYQEALDTVAQTVSRGPAPQPLMKVAVAALAKDEAESELASLNKALVDVTKLLSDTEKTLDTEQKKVAGLTTAVTNAELAFKASTDQVARQGLAETWQKAAEALAAVEGKIAVQTQVVSRCKAHKLDLTEQQKAAATTATAAAKTFLDAETFATSVAGAEATLAAVKAQRALEVKRLDLAAIEKDLRILNDKADLADSVVEEVEAQIAVAQSPSDDDVKKEREARTGALKDALDKGPEALAEAQKTWKDEIDGVARMFKDDAVGRKQSLARLEDRRNAANTALIETNKALQEAKKALAQVAPDPVDARKKAEDTVSALETKLKDLQGTNARLKSQLKAGRVDDQRQQKVDDANIALARSTLDASVAAVELQKAEKDGASDLETKRARALKAAAEEALRRAEQQQGLADMATREARNDVRLSELSRNRTRTSLRELEEKLVQAGAPLTWDDAAKKLKAVTIPRFEQELKKAEINLSLAYNDLKAAQEAAKAAAQTLTEAKKAHDLLA